MKRWSTISGIPALAKAEVDFVGWMIRPKGKTVYFLSLIV
jgi:hypothetical protein